MRNFNFAVENFTEVYQWLLVTFGEAEVNHACYFTPPFVRWLDDKRTYQAYSAITIDNEDISIQMKLCWGHIALS